MMKIALVADAHLIAQNDPCADLHRTRAFFKNAWPSFVFLLDRLNEESPDLVVFLGDLVDWFSPQNVEFALDLIGRLKMPWTMTLGNHDVRFPTRPSRLSRSAGSTLSLARETTGRRVAAMAGRADLPVMVLIC